MKGEYSVNKERDCSYYFGLNPTKKFLEKNRLLSIVRGHQVFIEGFHMHKWDGPNSFPYVITIFSAPNYCGFYDNKGAVLCLENNNELNLKQFEVTEAPYRLPNNMDCFTWSVPFLAEKIMSLMNNMLDKVGYESMQHDDSMKDKVDIARFEANKEKRRQVFKTKMHAFLQMQKIL